MSAWRMILWDQEGNLCQFGVRCIGTRRGTYASLVYDTSGREGEPLPVWRTMHWDQSGNLCPFAVPVML